MPSAATTPRLGSFPAAGPGIGPRRTPLSRLINLLGVVVVLVCLVPTVLQGHVALPQFTVPLCVLSLTAWAAAVLLPTRWTLTPTGARMLRVLQLLMVVSGAIAAWNVNGLMIVPVIAGIIQLAAWDATWVGYTAAAVSGGIILTGTIIKALADPDQVMVSEVLSLLAGVLLALLGGNNRRQARNREAASREALAQADSAREEQARADALALRQGLARDMHDVLAHSLGGLVIQIDAAEAQLEAGKSDAALIRLHDARAMAASGLAEARRAVDALRADSESGKGAGKSVRGVDLGETIIDLMDAHERNGGTIEFIQTGQPRDLGASAATALRRGMQEALSNARKHAPGAPVSVRIAWGVDDVQLTVRNPLSTSPPSSTEERGQAVERLAESGSGRGLAGIRERFAALPGGSAECGQRRGSFEVHVTAPARAMASDLNERTTMNRQR